ncbi:MAG: hypothetical protein KDD69_18245, partial [Bdellovibrionales bacterium]|nr:hypothetical protein [Bdellovibrionales bacterium]
IVIGVKATSIEPVTEALKLATGLEAELRDSLYVGEYDLFRLPEKLQVKYNYVGFQGAWDYPDQKGFGVLVVADETERPDYVRELVTALGFESSVIEEFEW